MPTRKNTAAFLVAVCMALGVSACGKADRPPMEAAQSEARIEESAAPSAEQDQLPENVAEETEPVKTPAEESRAPEIAEPAAQTDALVVYFSATGTTKRVAETIADIADADIYAIVPADPYSAEDLNYNDSGSRASAEMNDPDARPEIGSEALALDGYSRLYIGYPIWWGDAPRIMSTFVERHDFEGITVVPFCTSGSSGIGSSAQQLAEQAKSGTWVSGRRFSGSVSESELRAWIDGLS